jgi:hypothetical protein
VELRKVAQLQQFAGESMNALEPDYIKEAA